MKSLLTVAVLGFATPAQAQPGLAQPAPRQVDTVDENVAVGLSLGGTAVAWGMVIAGASMENDGLATVGSFGTLFAPSFGHWYSRKAFTRGLGLRFLGLGLATVAFALVIDDLFEENADHEGTASGLLLIGAGAYIAGTVDDIVNASSSAREYNTRNITVVPTLNAHGGGLAIGGTF
jgi:hypothetical protein